VDCEKFESTLIDELYDELDDLTSAEAKRHASGCSRCGGLLAGLRATRKLALLPMVVPPPELEERILSAAREAQKVVPLKSRLQRVMSRAGNWAMRPQTAMAAVFLLAIGSSFVFMRRSAHAPASVTVKAEGAPVALASANATPTSAFDTKSAFGAHGTEEKADQLKREVVQGVSDTPAKAPTSDDVFADGLGNSALAKDKNAYAQNLDETRPMSNAAAPAGAPPPPNAAPAMVAQVSGGAANGKPINANPIDFNTAMNAYRARRFEEAARGFDALALADTKDSSSALWAARSLREARGCSVAVSRFTQVHTAVAGTNIGYEATLDEAGCQRELGNYALARSTVTYLLGVPTYAERAQEILDGMAPQSKKAAASPRAMPSPTATTKAAADTSF